MTTNAQGQQRKAFLPGFRIKVAGPRVFGDGDAYYFAHNSQTVMNPMDELHRASTCPRRKQRRARYRLSQ